MGANLGAISQSYASGSVSGNTVGGLVAVNLSSPGNIIPNGSITASFSTGSVVGGTNSYVGGLVGDGQASSSITQSYATGSVAGGRNSFVGGLVGSLDYQATISSSYATGPVSVGSFNPALSTMNSTAGGLVGVNSGTIATSYASGQVLGGSSSVIGGLTGANGGTISQSFATGNVSGGDNSLVGGLAGANLVATITTQTFTGSTSQTFTGIISQSYSTGSVTGGANSFVGGFVAENTGSIDQGYAVGSVKGGSGSILGGLVGSSSFAYPVGSGPGPGEVDSKGPGTVTNSYWDTYGTGQTASAGGTLATTTFLTTGFPNGFNSSVWTVNSGSSYPYLRWQMGNIPMPNSAALAAQAAAANVFYWNPNINVGLSWTGGTPTGPMVQVSTQGGNNTGVSASSGDQGTIINVSAAPLITPAAGNAGEATGNLTLQFTGGSKATVTAYSNGASEGLGSGTNEAWQCSALIVRYANQLGITGLSPDYSNVLSGKDVASQLGSVSNGKFMYLPNGSSQQPVVGAVISINGFDVPDKKGNTDPYGHVGIVQAVTPDKNGDGGFVVTLFDQNWPSGSQWSTVSFSKVGNSYVGKMRDSNAPNGELSVAGWANPVGL